jgi:hypothetical protein
MLMNQSIFILGAHKSGSSLLRSLLDGHPQLFAIPLETHLFQTAGFGYETLSPPRSFYWPTRFESPAVYVANRLLNFYL